MARVLLTRDRVYWLPWKRVYWPLPSIRCILWVHYSSCHVTIYNKLYLFFPCVCAHAQFKVTQLFVFHSSILRYKNLPYIVNPWNGMTPLGGKATVFSTVAGLFLSTAWTGLLALWLNTDRTSVSREKHSITWLTNQNFQIYSKLISNPNPNCGLR
jgi:hypothetical protein